ncbi:MAG: archease [Desulfomonilia bacterium]|jgi:SHS2 domain-containing protein|uniref:Archease domain-containing protein n=1 Tax=anaerobic digester metagenome TaxID=1263854 RepID=A0A485M4Z5_9ZZZZ|nr:archease [Deltaproteobacteria bacterium]HRS57479.1 archease [Desulfomonilia bacterium]HRV35847.1 archease [Desulfomonilia bacterium]
MPYTYLDEIAIADVAFEARADTREGLFVEAGDALMNVMVENLGSIRPLVRRSFHAQAEDLERLLFEYLQQFIFFKDAEQLLLRVSEVVITQEAGVLGLTAEAAGEKIDPKRHDLNADVKAVTLHRFRIRNEPDGWTATVVLDI